MNDPSRDDSMRARMKGIRGDIDQGWEDVSASARNMVDWRHYVRTHPWVCLGTAAVLGFLIVPKRSTAIHPDAATLTGLAKRGQLTITPAAAPRGLVNALLATVANMAVRSATAYVGQNAGRLLGRTEHPGTNHDDSHRTS